ncbi:MAG: PqqD family protein [Eubacterium sp.]|nr:PqqD family protein [Eubacterium sp.]MEE3400068.1 PqqD family protein [Eubacterium sp.]
MKRSKENYLDYVPIISDKHKWEADEEGNVTIFIENKGVFNRLAQLLLNKPKVSQLHLEQIGSFIFPLIDGKASIYEIGQKVGERFGDEAEPLYPRLAEYFKMLHNYGFIEYDK